jgi:putative ABC transport system permease protein
MTALIQDIRYAFRTLAKSPGLTAVSVATLAVGIGAATALFGVVSAVFFAPLGFAGEDRLVRLRDFQLSPDGRRELWNTSGRSFEAVREQNRVFEIVAAFNAGSAVLPASGETPPERLSVVGISDPLSKSLGVAPSLGRDFSDAETSAGAESRVLEISDSLARRRFGAPAAALGQPLVLDHSTFTVVGVLPPGFRFPYDADAWAPARILPTDEPAVFARMKPGIPVERARADLATISARRRAAHSEIARGFGMEAIPARRSLIENEERIALGLLAVIGVFLLLACANLASLLLARAIVRRRDAVIRMALGSDRIREIRIAVTEALVLSSVGAAGGVFLCVWTEPILSVLIPDNLRGQLAIAVPRFDPRLLAFAAGLAIATALLCAALPAWRTAGIPAEEILREGRTRQTGRGAQRLLSALAVGELALALALLSGAGLLTRYLQRLEQQPLGFEPRHLLTLQVHLPLRYRTGEERGRVAQEALARIAKTLRVVSAGATTVNPLAGGTWVTPVAVEGVPTDSGDGFPVNYRLITPGLLPAMGTTRIEGRDFDLRDTQASPPVAVVSRRLAKRFWPGLPALGRRLRFARPSGDNPWRTVVGVVEDVADAGDVRETWYLPYAQRAGTEGAEDLYLMVRSSGDPAALSASLRMAIAEVDPDLAAFGISTMENVRAEALARERFGAAAAKASGLAGLLLATLGVAGLAAYRVSQRREEIAIRLALGSPPRRLVWSLLRDGFWIVFAGLAIGTAVAISEERVLQHLLPELKPVPPFLLLSLCALLAGAALGAIAIPAIRGSRIDPLESLRRS